MESPLLQPIPTPKRKVVSGAHRTKKCGAWLSVRLDGNGGLVVWFGSDSTAKQGVGPEDLRELSALFAELADALEGK